MKKLKTIFILSAVILLIAGAYLFWIFNLPALKILAALIAFLAIFAVVIFSGAGRYFPLPAQFKRFINIYILFPAGRILGRLVIFNEDDVRRFFINANNSLSNSPSGRMLLLLPRCLQNSECAQDLSTDVSNCIACGRCQVAEILKMTGTKDVKVVLAGGGRQALEEIRDYDPDSIIAVACEAELVDGIRAVTNKPVWAIRNERPEGPCKNTRVDIGRIDELL